MKRRRKMHHRKPQSQFWIYCALATLIGGFIIFNVHYSRKRLRYIQEQQGVVSLRGSSSTVVVPRERWITSDSQAFVRFLLSDAVVFVTHSFCRESHYLILTPLVFQNDKNAADNAKNLIIVAGHSGEYNFHCRRRQLCCFIVVNSSSPAISTIYSHHEWTLGRCRA